MFYFSSFFLFVLVSPNISGALPQDEKSSATTFIVVPDVAATSTVVISWQPSDAANRPGDLGMPIEGTSFFSVGQECFSDTRNMQGSKFPNRGAYYTQAYKDAVSLRVKPINGPKKEQTLPTCTLVKIRRIVLMLATLQVSHLKFNPSLGSTANNRKRKLCGGCGLGPSAVWI